MTAQTGQLEQDSKNKTARTGHQERESRNSASRTEQTTAAMAQYVDKIGMYRL